MEETFHDPMTDRIMYYLGCEIEFPSIFFFSFFNILIVFAGFINKTDYAVETTT